MERFLEGLGLEAWAEDLFEDGWDSLEHLKYIQYEDLEALPDGMTRGHMRYLLGEVKKLQ